MHTNFTITRTSGTKNPLCRIFIVRKQIKFIDYEGNIFWYNTCTKKVSPLYVFEDKRCYKRIPIFYKKYLLSGNRSNFFTMKEIYYGITPVPKKYHLYMFLRMKDAIKESQYSTKI